MHEDTSNADADAPSTPNVTITGGDVPPGTTGSGVRASSSPSASPSPSSSRDPLDTLGGDQERTMDDAWGPDAMSRLRDTIDALREDDDPDWTEWELVWYLRRYKRLRDSTIETRLRQLRFMADHDDMPVDLHGSKDTIVNSFLRYVTYREEIEGAGATALVNDHQAIRTLGDMLGIPENVWPTRPSLPDRDDRWLPSPEQVYELLHTDFYTDPSPRRNTRNAWARYLLAFAFGFGVRMPSEAYELEVGDVDLEHGTVTITEPKKGYSRRELPVEPEWLLESRRHLALANWLKWREKLDPDTPKVFCRPDTGEAYSSKWALRQALCRAVDQVDGFDWWHPNISRYWCITARLIDTGGRHARVARWTGHTSVDRLINDYDQGARRLVRVHGEDWLNRAFSRASQDACRPRPPEKGARTTNPSRGEKWDRPTPHRSQGGFVALDPSETGEDDTEVPETHPPPGVATATPGGVAA